MVRPPCCCQNCRNLPSRLCPVASKYCPSPELAARLKGVSERRFSVSMLPRTCASYPYMSTRDSRRSRDQCSPGMAARVSVGVTQAARCRSDGRISACGTAPVIWPLRSSRLAWARRASESHIDSLEADGVVVTEDTPVAPLWGAPPTNGRSVQ